VCASVHLLGPVSGWVGEVGHLVRFVDVSWACVEVGRAGERVGWTCGGVGGIRGWVDAGGIGEAGCGQWSGKGARQGCG